mmetsp:Transcript_17911/g.56808  ORF Transcript_17911/g.56808 Transcript_17911/m.56808 type:complete len:245 (-) Transcript_17911:693-1427(-)
MYLSVSTAEPSSRRGFVASCTTWRVRDSTSSRWHSKSSQAKWTGTKTCSVAPSRGLWGVQIAACMFSSSTRRRSQRFCSVMRPCTKLAVRPMILGGGSAWWTTSLSAATNGWLPMAWWHSSRTSTEICVACRKLDCSALRRTSAMTTSTLLSLETLAHQSRSHCTVAPRSSATRRRPGSEEAERSSSACCLTSSTLFTAKTAFFPGSCSRKWSMARAAINVFPAPVGRLTMVLCSLQFWRASCW